MRRHRLQDEYRGRHLSAAPLVLLRRQFVEERRALRDRFDLEELLGQSSQRRESPDPLLKSQN